MKLQSFIQNNHYQGYAYSYPHKSAYRPLDSPRSLQDIWATENKEQLFLYVHIPFCEMRCGFCNLFTIANPKEELENPYLRQLKKQAIQVSKALGKNKFTRLAIGGGTPSFLSIQDLEYLFLILKDTMNAQLGQIPTSIETSPKTIFQEKLALFKEYGTTRISIGVQSFILEETKALGRPQKPKDVLHALQLIKDSGILEMNIDLIYGMAAQTNQSFQYSLDQSMSFQPTEIFLYPLYVRPLTGLGRKNKSWNDHRLSLYRFGRDYLETHGYEQISMRIFRRKTSTQLIVPPYNGPKDGMVSLGVGARSYTKDFHYSTEYAVGRSGVKDIIHAYNARTSEQFSTINYGVYLTDEEQKRRFIIKSLLEGQHLDFNAYSEYFGTLPLTDFPKLQELYSLNLVESIDNILQLNKAGLELSDVIGPWLYSNNVNAMMQKYDLI